jgi:cyclopropane fatty-acyl-phospholipid synthase-like methyltransferase
MRGRFKNWIRHVIPLSSRMRMAIWLDQHCWLPVPDYLAIGLVRDLLSDNPKKFHKFIWTHHLTGYAQWYDSEEVLFDVDQMQASRKELWSDLALVIQGLGLKPGDIHSVLEVGCSLGHLLRYLETSLFLDCKELVGIDIDAKAIEKGKRYLEKVGSKVWLIHGDMEFLDQFLGPLTFDMVLAAGVLSYLDEKDATQVVASMLHKAKKILVLAGLAGLDKDNSDLTHSELSPNHEKQWLHNFEAMIVAAGGRVVKSRCERSKRYGLQTIHFVFAVPN